MHEYTCPSCLIGQMAFTRTVTEGFCPHCLADVRVEFDADCVDGELVDASTVQALIYGEWMDEADIDLHRENEELRAKAELRIEMRCKACGEVAGWPHAKGCHMDKA